MNLTESLHQLRVESWRILTLLWQQNFLAPKWWFIVFTIALAYAIWWKLVDKRRIIELLLYGSFIAVIRVIFDNWGISSGRWAYIVDLFPLGYSLFINDLTIMPLSSMLVYQYSPNWKTFIARILVVEGIIWILLWPLGISLGILELYNWHLYYSFIFVVTTTIIMRAITIVGLNVQRKSRIRNGQLSSTLLVPEPAMKPLENNEHENREDH